MKKGTLLSLYLLSLLLLINVQTFATHLVGGEIVYQSVGNNQYEITLNYYRDCAGISAPSSAQIKVSVAGSVVATPSLPRFSTGQLNSVSCLGQSRCMGGQAPGFEQHVYRGIITIPAGASDVTIIYEECCRNVAITNLVDPGTHPIYLTSTINNTLLPTNSSPFFTSLPAITLLVGAPATINFGTIDIDGDSVAYEMVAPKGTNGAMIPYAGTHSVANPLVSSSPLVFNPTTGQMQFTPATVQNAVVSVAVKEYRFGQLISTIIREIQFVVVNGNNANYPSLTGVDSTSTFTTSVCVGDTLDFMIYGSDVDNGQILNLRVQGNDPRITVYNNTTTSPSARFYWVPTASDVSAIANTFIMQLSDNGCPPFTKIQPYSIYVNNCQSPVWPGDANADFVVTHYDILNIGRAFNYTGPVRANASTNWIGQPASDWSNDFVSGLNHKHADSNGDGVVDSLDLDAITLNYGLTHAKQHHRSSAGIPLDIIASNDTFLPGAVVNLPVHLGSSAEPANDVYGLAFTVDYDETKFDASSFAISFNNNWLGNAGNEVITFYKHDELNGSVDIAISRNNQTELSGLGEICNISLKLQNQFADSNITADVVIGQHVLEDFAGTAIPMLPNDAIIIGALPKDTATNPIDTTTNPIDTATNPIDTTEVGINDLQPPLRIYPNPATSVVKVQMNADLRYINVYNITGKLLVSQQTIGSSTTIIDISGFETGVYILSGHSIDGKRYYDKFVKTDR